MKTTKARLVLVYISTFLIGLMFTSLGYAEIDPESVVGMWLLDEGKETTAKDSSGEENDGTLMEGPKWVNGKFGAALEFDGTDDYVSAGDTDGLSGGAGMNDRELFGEIAVRKGYCKRGDIRKALCKQRSLRKRGRHKLIGMILLEQGAIDNAQLISILRYIQMLRPAPRDIIDLGPGAAQPSPHPTP